MPDSYLRIVEPEQDNQNYLGDTGGGYPLAGGMNWLGQHIGSYLDDVFSGKIAKEGVLGQASAYDPNRSFAANALDPAAIERATDVAMGVSGGGLTFYGQKAAGANKLNLGRAQFREALIDNPEAIRQKYGWHRGVDDQWRWEGSDDAARTTISNYRQKLDELDQPPSFEQMFGDGPKTSRQPVLSDLLDHPELYNNYPELANVKVHHDPGMGQAAYYPHNDTIGISKYLLDRPEQLKSTLLHEIQHAIQTREKFARGGNPNEFLPPEYLTHSTHRFDLYDDILDLARSKNIPEDTVDQMIYNIERGRKKPNDYPEFSGKLEGYKRQYDISEGMQKQAEEMYRKLAGETEARLTQSRMDLTPAERQQYSPLYSGPSGHDVYHKLSPEYPPSEQIVLHEPQKYSAADPLVKYFTNLFQ